MRTSFLFLLGSFGVCSAGWMAGCSGAPNDTEQTQATIEDNASFPCSQLAAPDQPANCTSCSGSSCQANGCSGGKWCHTTTNRCVKAPTNCPDDAGSGPPDTGPPDTGAPDTGAPDTGAPDTGTPDTGAPDTGGADTGGGGTIVNLPSPTLPERTLTTLAFGVTGDTRPPNSQTTAYPQMQKNIIGSIFSGLQAQGVPLIVGTGDYAFSSTAAGSAVPQYDNYMSARASFSGLYLPTMGNHECNGFTDSNCPVGSFTGMTQDYVNVILTPSTGQSSPYYSAAFSAADGSWTAKFIFIAANAWDSSQQSWLAATLAVRTTYTFTIRHEPFNDARAPGVTPSESLMSSSFNSGELTLSMTGHTHLIQLPGGTQPYGDSFGSTQAYEIIIGNGGAPLDGGPTYGYAVATRRASDGAIVTQVFESANSSGTPIVPNTPDPNFRFAVNANGTPNSSTTLP
jgi:hypothetical protein